MLHPVSEHSLTGWRYDMTETTGTRLVRRFYDDVLNRGQDALIGELFASDYTVHSGFSNEGARGPDGVRTTLAQLRSAFADLHLDVEEVIGDGDRVAARLTMRGRHVGDFFGRSPRGNPIEQRGMVFYRVEDGRLA